MVRQWRAASWGRDIVVRGGGRVCILVVLAWVLPWGSSRGGTAPGHAPMATWVHGREPSATGGEGAEKEAKRAASRRGESPKDSTPLPRVDMARSGYLKDLRVHDEKKTTDIGATLRVSVCPDMYMYLMAKELADLEERGYEGAEIESRMRKAAVRNERYKGKILFRVSLTSADEETYILFSKKLAGHISLTQKGTRSFSVLNQDPGLKFETWKVFDGSGRGYKRLSFCALRKMEFEFYSSAVKGTEKEPIGVALRDLVVQSTRPDPNHSINVKERQLSWKFKDLVLAKGLEVEFMPGKWKAPKPPAAFVKLLERVEK